MTPRAPRIAADVGYPVLAGALVLVGTLALLSAQPVGVFWDDGVYLVSARALADGEGYRFAHLPGSPPAVHFPPAWPALLALVWLARPEFPANVEWLRLLNPVLLGIGAALTALFGVRRLGLPPQVAAVAAVLFACALPVLVLANVLFSEPLFLAVLLAALLVADRAAIAGGVRRAAAAGALAGGLALVRSGGLVLLPAVAAAWLTRRRVREAVVALVAGLAVILPWQLWAAGATAALPEPLRGSYGPYLPWFLAAAGERGVGFVTAIVRQNVVALERSLAVMFFPFGPRDLRPLLVALTCVGAVLGLAHAWRGARTALFFVAGHIATVLVWPYAPDRFAWGVWPIAGVLLASGGVAVYRLARDPRARVGARASAAVVLLVLAAAAAGEAAYTVRGVARGWVDVAQRRNAERLGPVADWIRTHTARSDVVACDGEPFVHLYTGRTVVPVHILSADEYLAGTPLEQAADDLRALFSVGRPRYAVFSAGAPELFAAHLLDGANGTPRLARIDTLPGGGAAFRVEYPD